LNENYGGHNLSHASKPIMMKLKGVQASAVHPGSLFTITTSENGIVTLYQDGVKIHAFALPENCGRISLGMFLDADSEVTLL